jgi:nicotinamide-nucleotide adenylyltransferase
MKAVYLGRFQPLHIGHKKVIERYQDEYEEFALVIGSADESRTDDNPLTAEEREEVIRECFPHLEIVHKEDHESDEQWSKDLEEKVDADIVISQNGLVKQLITDYTSMEIEKQELYDPEIYSGTEVRRRVKSDEEWRYLVPKCAKEKIEQLVDTIKKSGTQYDFEPGWKRENSYNNTV